jgi:hypothetical protein
MSDIPTSAPASFRQRLARHAFPIAAIALGALAFHWQALHAEEERVRERTDARVETLAQTAALALREPMLRQSAPAVMILVEGLAREIPGVLSARVGGKDGQAIAETEAEHIDEADSRAARALTLPIFVKDASGAEAAIGTLDLRVSTKEVEEVAAANLQLLMIEGALCFLLCGGLFVIARKRGKAPATSPAKPAVANPQAPAASPAKSAQPATARGKKEKAAPKPRGPLPSSSSKPADEPVEVLLNSPPPPPPPAESH